MSIILNKNIYTNLISLRKGYHVFFFIIHYSSDIFFKVHNEFSKMNFQIFTVNINAFAFSSFFFYMKSCEIIQNSARKNASTIFFNIDSILIL
jgi:hypothetical protein